MRCSGFRSATSISRPRVAGRGDQPGEGGGHQKRTYRYRIGVDGFRDAGGRCAGRLRSPRYVRMSKPTAARRRWHSAATGRATRNGATLPSTAVGRRRWRRARSRRRASGHRRQSACASSAIPTVALPKTIFASSVLPHSRQLRRRRARSRRISRLHQRTCRACRTVRRTRAHGSDETDDRGRRGRRRCGDGRWRPAAPDFRRRLLYQAVCRDDRGRASLGLEPNAIRRLGALAVVVTEDAKRLSGRLRLSNQETKTLDSMGHRWWRLGGMDGTTARRRLYRLGAERYRDRLMLAWARSGDEAECPRWRELVSLPERWSVPNFPLKAADFVARGIAEGPALGHVLALAEDAWLAADFPAERPALDAIADQTVTRFNRDHRKSSIFSGFADISLAQLFLVGGVALFASVLGDFADGTGALMPLVLVPLIGAEPVVPIIAISAIFTNLSRTAAYLRYADRRRALIVILAAAVATALGAYGYTRLSNAGAALVIGTMLMSSVPLRRLARRRNIKSAMRGLRSARQVMASWSAAPRVRA